MKRFSLFVGFMVLLSGAVYADTTKSLIRVSGLTKSEFRSLVKGDRDIAKTGPGLVEMVVDQDELRKFGRSGTKMSVLIPDLDAYIAGILRSQTPTAKYLNYDTVTAKLQEYAAAYPSIASLTSLGKTVEGHEIWAMKVSDNPGKDEKEPAVLIDGLHHAREWTTVEIPMEALKQILEGYGKDERLTRMVNDREIWFVPLLNPDGYTFSQTQSKYWRKNRRKIDNSNYGVDLNRNYGYKWGLTGASNSPSSDVYHGKEPFSENETLAMKTLGDKEHFQASLSFHSYSELVLYPFAYDYNAPCEDTPILSKLAKEMAAFNNYTPENCTELYPCTGVSDDWFYGEHKTLAFTIEVGQTFIPPATEIPEQCKLNVPCIFHLIEKAGEYAVNSPTGNPEIIANLDLTTALNALAEGKNLLSSFSGEARMKVIDRQQIAGKRVAELVSKDLINQDTTSWKKLQTTIGAEFVKPMVKAQVLFEHVHGKFIRPDILAEIQN